ncbi:MAG: hypothetical protein CVU11_15700, partial [Bacteroidetes bacterium HGW-Bacteroidetes-6]
WSLNTTDLGSIGVQGQSNQWLINNTYTGGTWLLLGMIPITVVNTPNQPAPVTNSPTSKYLHINYPASGIYNACYVDNTVTLNGGVVGTNFAKMNSDISTVGQTGVTLEFYWLGHGAVGKLYYSTNNGTTWTQVGGSFAGQGTWTLASITNIAFDNQASLRFGYLFDNSVAGTGLDPAFSIDQIKLYAPSAGTPPVANFSSSDTTICVGSCINFTDMSTNTPTSWAWTFAGAATASSGAQNPSGICYNVVGDYTVELTATNASGSDVETKTSFIHVVALPSVTASATVNPICAGQNTDISAGGATSYVWDQGLGSGSGFTVAPGSSTTYSVTGTDANGCVNTAQVIINVNSLPTIDITGTSPICIGDNSILSGTGGTGYNWSTLESTDSILVSPATTTTYTVTGTDGTCSNTASFQVVVNTVPVASIAGPTSVCAGGTVTLTATGGVGVYNFDWSTLEVTADIDVSPSANTTYYVTVSAGTCSDSASHTVTVSPLPVIGIAGTASICAGDNSILTASGGTGYTWSTTQTINPITVNPTTTTTYTVTGTDGTCSNTSSFDVVVNPLPSIGISGISAICEGDNTTLSGTGGTSYEWSTLETTNSIVVAPLSTQTYTVTGTDGTCSNTSSTTVTVNSVPVAAITGDTIVCAGDVTILTASGGTGYLWSNAATSTSVSVSPSVNQYYYVTVSNGPCSDVDSVFVTVNPLPVADAGNDTTIYLGTSVNLLGTGGLLYSWTPPDGLSCTDCSNPVATPDQTTLYTLVVTDANGCSSSDDVLITVEYNCGDVFVPTAFSPNADGYNDVFVVRGNCIETITFKIFDRWGEKVYETTIPGEGWDGEFQGQPVNGGVYSYYYSGTLITGDIITGKGNVTLIR